jgi:putative FmdB family regulatory protein
MPTYVYKCIPNEHVFEKKQKFSDPPLTACVVCGEEVRKVVNSVGIVFKGSGFYINDSKSKKSTTSPASNGKSETTAEEKPEVKSDATAETKTDNKAEKKVEKKQQPVAAEA